MKLKSLKLTNFKGIKSFSMEPDGKDISIYATNKLGKTTIADAVPWLLYDLDNMGKTFNPKPLNLTGEAAHGIASVVEAIFIFDDGSDDLTLKKSFAENWTKKHGIGKKVFEGHTTQYYVDDMEVSVRKKDYDERLSQIVSSTILKLLSSTRFFAEGEQKTKRKDDPNRWDWEKRRELLFDISDDMPTDEDIIKSKTILSRVPEILDGKSFEVRKAGIKERQKGLNKKSLEIPIQIKERERDLPNVSGLDLPVIEKELANLSKALTQKNEEAARIEAGGEIAEKIKKQREIEGELLGIENQVAKDQGQVEAVAGKKLAEMEDLKFKNERQLKEILLAIEARTKINECAKKDIASLKKEWHEINDSVFNEGDVICPTCKQEYPGDKAQEIQERFNTKKAEKLDNINKSGKLLVGSIKDRSDQGEVDRAEVTIYEGNIKELTKTIDDLKKTQDPETGPPKENKKQEALALDLTELKLNINGLRANSHEALEKVQAEIFAISEKRIAAGRKQQTLESHKRGQKRIKELSDQQKTVAAEYESLEEHLFILNEFTKTKAAMVEGKISEKFTITNFKLFNIQVNGTVDDCCEVVGDGIPWNAGLNNSSQNNAGLDCINTLSEHFGLNLVIFIDNAESILKTIPSKSQVVKLIVSETVQCTKCKWTGLHSETSKKERKDGSVEEKCPKCNKDIKEYKGLVIRS